MCKDCGCEEGNARAYFEAGKETDTEHVHTLLMPDGTGELHIHVHVHSHGHHHHESGKPEAVEAQAHESRTVALETRVLARNDEDAGRNRAFLAHRNVASVNLISSPGSGKTRLLEMTLDRLANEIPCAVITGDQQTDNDARRMSGRGAPVVQIETRSSCHLSAAQVAARLEEVVAPDTRLLFIENVGNLVCPAAFDLGEQVKIALLSVTEGEDKPLKYPVLFSDSPVCIVTKIDLLPHLEVDLRKIHDAVRRIRPDAKIYDVSAKTGEGMDQWLSYLRSIVRS